MAHGDLLTHKVVTIVSWILAAYVSIRYFVGRSPSDKHNPYHVADTPFSSNIIVTLVYWAILFALQILFVVQIFLPWANSPLSTNASQVKGVAWHFTGFNFLHFIWTLLFVKGHYFWSEVILVVNMLNILALYVTHKTYANRRANLWILVHLPTAAFPLSWLLYAVFWNGAVLFHVHKLVGRIIANITIWLFLAIPGAFVAVYNDYGVGISSSILMFGLGMGQFLTKVFALQWIFAFIISGTLFVLSLVAAATSARSETSNEDAPLLS